MNILQNLKNLHGGLKRTLEKHGGKLIDTPLKYTRTCLKCGNTLSSFGHQNLIIIL